MLRDTTDFSILVSDEEIYISFHSNVRKTILSQIQYSISK